MKKFVTWILAAVMLLGLTACGGEPTIGPGAAAPEPPDGLIEQAQRDFSSRNSMRVDYRMHLTMDTKDRSEEVSTDMIADMTGLQGDSIAFSASGSIGSGPQEVSLDMTYVDGMFYTDMGGMKFCYAMPATDAMQYVSGYTDPVEQNEVLTDKSYRRVDGGWEISFKVARDKIDTLFEEVFSGTSSIGDIPVSNLGLYSSDASGYLGITDNGVVDSMGLTFLMGFTDESAGDMKFKMELQLLYEYPEDLTVQAPEDADTYMQG